MAVLAADVNISFIGGYLTAPFAVNVADTYYQGSLVFIDTAGGSQVLPASADMCCGISPLKQVLGTSDLAEVVVRGLCWMPVGTAITAADEGDWLIQDISVTQSDNPADMVSGLDSTAAAGDSIIGKIMRVTATQMLIYISPSITGNMYVATAGWGG